MTNAFDAADGSPTPTPTPTPWSCLSWRRRPSARKVRVVLGCSAAAAALVVLFCYRAGQPKIGCTNDPNQPARYPPTSCVSSRPRYVGVEYDVPSRPYMLTWGIVIGVVVMLAALAYLWWPRRARPLAWMEFERRSATVRAALAEQYARTHDPSVGRKLEKFDTDYAEIVAQYAPRRRPSG
ncbi:hypothetical protein AAFP30_22240 [Gordonia sp. CPCC 205515]|uniref:hypothetical protein n=1 Tax=Gordonia sp. CPCC 205515 TaxID=3140791 RepID=UPI003AF3C11A